MADDKTLSERIIQTADALAQWKEMEPLVAPVTSIVNQYRDVIDGVGQVFAVVGFFWNIYSSMEKAKEDAAQQQAMVRQITAAVNGMIERSTIEIKQHIDRKEIQDVVIAANSVQQGFRHDVLPYAKTFPLTGFDLGPLDLLISKARDAIERLHALIDARAKEGDGGAIIIMFRNLHAVVQCKLVMDRWRHGVTQEVLNEADYEVTRMIQVWVPVVRGLQLMSDKSFSQGIVHFKVGGNGRPEFNKYSYYYQGKAQPVHGSNKAPVAQAFIASRKAARDTVIPQELFEWNRYPYKILNEIRELKKQIPA